MWLHTYNVCVWCLLLYNLECMWNKLVYLKFGINTIIKWFHKLGMKFSKEKKKVLVYKGFLKESPILLNIILNYL